MHFCGLVSALIGFSALFLLVIKQGVSLDEASFLRHSGSVREGRAKHLGLSSPPISGSSRLVLSPPQKMCAISDFGAVDVAAGVGVPTVAGWVGVEARAPGSVMLAAIG